MGRRQFLFTAGATSTSVLAFKKLAGLAGPIINTEDRGDGGKLDIEN